MTVLQLADRQNEVHDAIIAKLEELLAEARAGNISGVAIATIDRDKEMAVWSRYESLFQIVGAVTFLQHDLLHLSGQ
jgi:hypothetical protein